MPDDPRPEDVKDTDVQDAGTAVAEQAPEGGEAAPVKLEQQVEMTDVGPCKKHIKVTIDRKSIDAKLAEKYKKIVPESNVAGFRPGKAPRALVVRRYQKEVGDQVKAEVLLESLQQLAEEHDVAPLTAPDIDPMRIELPDKGPLVYEFAVEVRPQFDVPNYKGLKLRRPVRTFTDEDVAREEAALIRPYGQLVPKPDGKADLGDVLVCTITNMDGARQIGTIPETLLRVEPQLAFKDGVAENFGEQVKGVAAGEKRVADVKLSDLTADPTLRGRTVQAHIDVKEVKTVQLPELTREFLSETFGIQSREQLQELIRVLLNRRLENMQQQSFREQILQQVGSSANWQLPEDLLRRQFRQALNRRVMQLKANGFSDEEIESKRRLLQQDVLQSTAFALKEHFVLQKIAEMEKIDVTDDDIDAEIERIAEQNDESPRKLRARLEREEMMDALAAEMIEQRALDLILDTAEYEDYEIGRSEEETPVATVEAQTVPGQMREPGAESPPAAEGETPPAAETQS